MICFVVNLVYLLLRLLQLLLVFINGYNIGRNPSFFVFIQIIVIFVIIAGLLYTDHEGVILHQYLIYIFLLIVTAYGYFFWIFLLYTLYHLN